MLHQTKTGSLMRQIKACGRTTFCFGRGFKDGLAIWGDTWWAKLAGYSLQHLQLKAGLLNIAQNIQNSVRSGAVIALLLQHRLILEFVAALSRWPRARYWKGLPRLVADPQIVDQTRWSRGQKNYPLLVHWKLFIFGVRGNRAGGPHGLADNSKDFQGLNKKNTTKNKDMHWLDPLYP